jgi:CRP/FNR family transcriptional regulator, cyclic AMP receptor protein
VSARVFFFDLTSLPPENIVSYPDNGVVFLKGAPGDNAYVVRTGKVEIREAGRAIETIGPGEIFGEMALIDDEARSASAVAVEPTDLAVIDQEAFNLLVREKPDFALAVMHMMARRIRLMNALQRPAEEIQTIRRAALG